MIVWPIDTTRTAYEQTDHERYVISLDERRRMAAASRSDSSKQVNGHERSAR